MRLSLFLGSLPVWSFHASLRLPAPYYPTQQLMMNPLPPVPGILPSASPPTASGASWATFLTDLMGFIAFAWSVLNAASLLSLCCPLSLEMLMPPLQEQMGLNWSSGL